MIINSKNIIKTVNAVSTNLSSRLDIKAAVVAANSGDIIKLGCGDYLKTKTIVINKPSEIQEYKFMIKSPGRSIVGDGKNLCKPKTSGSTKSTLILNGVN